MSLPVDRELRRLLRHGTFAQVLDHALVTRGLSLERVQHHLAAQGIRVSRAALSYWRHGRSRPERAESLRAVRGLEDVLGLPAESLVSMLGRPQPRGRSTPKVVDRRRLWPTHAPLFASLDAPPDGQLLHLDVHEHVRVDADRQFRQLHTKLVFEATTDRVDRCVIQLWTEDPIHPRLVGQRYCRPGRIRTDDATGATVCELMLDQRLAAGERSVVEYTWEFEPGNELTTFHRRFTRSVRQYLLQVEFDGTAPVNCAPYWQASLEAPRHLDPPLWISASNTAHLVVTDVRPGIVGLRWAWD